MRFDITGWPWPHLEKPTAPGAKIGDKVKVKDRDGTVKFIGTIREIDPDGTIHAMDLQYDNPDGYRPWDPGM